MTAKRIAELRSEANSNITEYLTPLLSECLNEIERLQTENARLEAELESHCFEISRPMLLARNDQLNAEVTALKEALGHCRKLLE